MESDNVSREVQKRPRPVVSCLNCRRKKLKCDRLLPCHQCNKSGISKECAYAPGQKPDQNLSKDQDTVKRRRVEESDRGSARSGEVSAARFDELQTRVRQLEQALQSRKDHRSTSDAISPPADIPTEGLHTSMPFDSQYFADYLPQLASLNENTVTRFEAVVSFAAGLSRADCLEELSVVAADIRNLHEVVHSPKLPTSASYTEMQDVLSHMRRLLPDTHICLTLVDLYFEYFENCLRVLHQPTASAGFQAFLSSTLHREERNSCLPLLLSVISIASSLGTISECDLPNLHGESDGIGAYQLIRNYLHLLTTREWKRMANIQIAVLSLELHNSCPLEAADTWLWSGTILRRAMAAGIHDPSSTFGDIFETEARRKLWLTILEQDLTSSIGANMPPNCPSREGLPPLSVDDDELQPGMTRSPRCKNIEKWTDGICQYVLAQSFNDRMEVYMLASSCKPVSYATLLQHTRRLEQCIQDLPQYFRFGLSDESSNTPSRLVTQMKMDFLLRRPLSASYAPYAAHMPPEDTFKEARIPWIQSVTFSASFQDLFDLKYPLIELPRPEGLWDLFYCTYEWENVQFFLANFLELQRLRNLSLDAPDTPSADFFGHTLRSTIKVPGWTIESITKSIEEQLDAFIRRVGRRRNNLRDIVRWIAILGSLRVNPTCSRHHAIKNELQSLVTALKNRFSSRIDQLKSRSDRTRSGWNDQNNRAWLQKYLHEDVDDVDLEHFATVTPGKENDTSIRLRLLWTRYYP